MIERKWMKSGLRVSGHMLWAGAALTVCSFAVWIPPSLEASTQDNVLRIDTQLVLVDVVVRDGDVPVPNLGEEDFRVFDEGVEQSIAVFETAVADADPGGARELPAGFASNRRNHRGQIQNSATAILIDRLNTPMDAQIFVNERLLEFLESSDATDEIALYELGSEGLLLLHDFRDDPRNLIEIARRLEPEYSNALASSDSLGGFESTLDSIGLDRELSEGFLQDDPGFQRLSSDYFLNERAQRTSAALEIIARHLDGLRGRKNLVWLSGRFPFAFDARRRTDLAREVEYSTLIQMEDIGRVIMEANVAIYPVDVRGPGGEGTDVGSILQHLAERTGGRLFQTNGIEAAIETAVTDARTIYTVGFYPSELPLDGSFRKLRIEVTGDDKFDVRYRPGYFGFAESDRLAPDVGLAELLSSPQDATGVGLVGIATQVPDGTSFEVITVVEVHDLSLVSIGGRRLGVVDVGLVFRASDDGTIYVFPAETHSVNLTEAQYQEDEAGVVITWVIETEGRPGSFRIVVQDQGTNSAGSIWVEATLPPD